MDTSVYNYYYRFDISNQAADSSDIRVDTDITADEVPNKEIMTASYGLVIRATASGGATVDQSVTVNVFICGNETVVGSEGDEDLYADTIIGSADSQEFLLTNLLASNDSDFCEIKNFTLTSDD